LLALILVLRWAYRKATGSDVPGNDQPGDRTP
jgi:hypothetical protein